MLDFYLFLFDCILVVFHHVPILSCLFGHFRCRYRKISNFSNLCLFVDMTYDSLFMAILFLIYVVVHQVRHLRATLWNSSRVFGSVMHVTMGLGRRLANQVTDYYLFFVISCC